MSWPDAATGRRPATLRRPGSPGRVHLRGHDGLHLAPTASRVRPLGPDRTPALHRVDRRPRVGQAAPPGPGRARRPRGLGLLALRDRLGEPAGPERGALTGPNPVDRVCPSRSASPAPTSTTARPSKPWCRGSRRSAPVGARAADALPSSMATRATTTTTCADGFVSAASATASPARASSPPRGWPDTAGRSSARCPGWAAAAACTAVTNARPSTSWPSPPLPAAAPPAHSPPVITTQCYHR